MRLSVKTKLLLLAAVPTAFLFAMGIVAAVVLGQLNDRAATMYADATVPMGEISEARALLGDIDSQVLRATLTGDAADYASVAGADAVAIDALMAGLARDPEDLASFQAFDTAWAEYGSVVEGILADAAAGDPARLAAAEAAYFASAKDLYATVDGALGALGTLHADAAAALSAEVASTHAAALVLTWISVVLAAFISLALAWVLARRMQRAAVTVQTTLGSLTDNCAAWLQDGLVRLAEGDLTQEVRPVTPAIERWDNDEIGATAVHVNTLRTRLITTIDAYNAAREGLTASLLEVRDAAGAVAATSTQLDSAAAQSGAAVSQVAHTVAQVAQGAAEQARAATATSQATTELGSVLDHVEAGARDTTVRVAETASTIESMAVSIEVASAATQDILRVSREASDAATRGAEAVGMTVAGMERIASSASTAADRVRELGAKGDEISAIVETIDDIAEQTNLLALNAAIEAARAGDSGKGFAVVADEVRRLAERSSRATKEIDALIAQVLKGTHDAIAAMQAGVTEVANGTDLANESGRALEAIARSTGDATQSAARINEAVIALQASAASVETAISGIAAIANTTDASAITMHASASLVRAEISSIAAVSEENSAAAEDASAASEEMAAQAEEVGAAASSLAGMAERLQTVVASFRLAGIEDAAPVRNRRVDDLRPGQRAEDVRGGLRVERRRYDRAA